MKKIFLTFCLFSITISSFTQDVVIQQSDSVILEPPLIPAIEIPDDLTQVDEYMRLFQYRKALDLMAKMEPTKALLEKKAVCHTNLYEYPQAIEILEQFSKRNPKDVALKLQLISLYEPTQKYSKTMSCYQELVNMDPTNDYYRIQMANFLYSRDNFKDALETYKSVCDSCDNNFLVRRLAMCYEKLNDIKTAKYHYAKAWDLDTTDGFSAATLVKLLIVDKQYDLAIYASDRYVAFDSTYSPMNSLNAFAYYCSDMYDKSAGLFQKCMQKGDSSLLVTRGLGISHFFMERDSLANLPLQLAYTKDTTNLKVLYPLAQTYYNLGNYPEAIECYKELLKRKVPTEEELYKYYKGLGDAYYDNEDFELAIGKLHMALQHVIEYRDKVELHKKMAHCFDHELKDYIRALTHYESYKSGLVSREIFLGGGEDDLSELDLPENVIAEIDAVRMEIKELDQRIASLKDSINGNKNVKYITIPASNDSTVTNKSIKTIAVASDSTSKAIQMIEFDK
jgi:tetratricopeptide (TPR) repeat protein